MPQRRASSSLTRRKPGRSPPASQAHSSPCPFLAVLNAGIRSLLRDEHTEPETIDVLHSEDTQPPPDRPDTTNVTWSP
jgi:hypothetical protein